MTISVYDADGFYIGDYDPYAVEVEGGGSFTDFLIGLGLTALAVVLL